VWKWLFFKVFFTLKYIKIIFFYFKKIIFKINISNRLKILKNYLKLILKKNSLKIYVTKEPPLVYLYIYLNSSKKEI
jgi:hypothetical protein